MNNEERTELIASYIVDVPDFPKPGVVFKDITPLLAHPEAYRACIEALVDIAPQGVDVVVGMEARGFVFAAPVALSLGVGFVPVRKPGKLPRDVYAHTFDLEYGQDTLTVHQDAIPEGAKVFVVDDVLATGGTIGATAQLIKYLGAELVEVGVVLELGFLGGRDHLTKLGIERVSPVLTA
ncbi:MAG: adenine phosphoribosyltransferase [Propionibacteriaceae bacterium]|nr:adenine phosphoribosyltransferase [Propionibacteriaceae bacterium]